MPASNFTNSKRFVSLIHEVEELYQDIEEEVQVAKDKNLIPETPLFLNPNWQMLCKSGLISENDVWESIVKHEDYNEMILAKLEYLIYYIYTYNIGYKEAYELILTLNYDKLTPEIRLKITDLLLEISNLQSINSVDASYEFYITILTQVKDHPTLLSQLLEDFLEPLLIIIKLPGSNKKYDLVNFLSSLLAYVDKETQSLINQILEAEPFSKNSSDTLRNNQIIPTKSDVEAYINKLTKTKYRIPDTEDINTLINFARHGFSIYIMQYLNAISPSNLQTLMLNSYELFSSLKAGGFKDEVETLITKYFPLQVLDYEGLLNNLRANLFKKYVKDVFESLNIDLNNNLSSKIENLLKNLTYAEIKFLSLILEKHGVFSLKFYNFLSSKGKEVIEVAKTGSELLVSRNTVTNIVSTRSAELWLELSNSGIPVAQIKSGEYLEQKDLIRIESAYGGMAVGDYIAMIAGGDLTLFSFLSAISTESLKVNSRRMFEFIRFYYGGKDNLLDEIITQCLKIIDEVESKGIVLTNQHFNQYVIQFVDWDSILEESSEAVTINTLPENSEHITDDPRRIVELNKKGVRKFNPLVRLIDLDELVTEQDIPSYQSTDFALVA